jgi:hypothetical protein
MSYTCAIMPLFVRALRPKDVPGTLLNMALLNLGSADPNLRTAAYNLLCALTSTFDLKIEGHLLETNGVCIPSNNTVNQLRGPLYYQCS